MQPAAVEGRFGQHEAGDNGSGLRWFEVEIVTEAGDYVGRIRLPGGRSALDELMDERNAYLGLWHARREGAAGGDDYLAIHKASIRYITINGAAEPLEGTA